MAAAREKLQSLLGKNRILEQDCPGPAIFNICVISGNLFYLPKLKFPQVKIWTIESLKLLQEGL